MAGHGADAGATTGAKVACRPAVGLREFAVADPERTVATHEPAVDALGLTAGYLGGTLASPERTVDDPDVPVGRHDLP
jgi:hypothetical protein